MSQHREITPQSLEYYTSQLAIKIGDHYYNKQEIDSRTEHNARAYYLTDKEWEEQDPILKAGELGISSTSGFMKIGNGIDKWSDMDYAIFPVSLSQRSDNLLLKENNDNLFLSEALMRKLMLDVIYTYHSDTKSKEYVTADGYTFLTADNMIFVHRS